MLEKMKKGRWPNDSAQWPDLAHAKRDARAASRPMTGSHAPVAILHKRP